MLLQSQERIFLIFNWAFTVKSASLPHERKSIIHTQSALLPQCFFNVCMCCYVSWLFSLVVCSVCGVERGGGGGGGVWKC